MGIPAAAVAGAAGHISAHDAIRAALLANFNSDDSMKSSAVAPHDASKITSGVVAAARLGTGTANGTTFLRGDGTYATPAGSDISNLTYTA